MIVSHHPLLFRGTRCVSPAAGDYVSRCIYQAIRRGMVLYAAHTNLDNAPYGVNYILASRLGLTRLKPLASIPASRVEGLDETFRTLSGSGVIGELQEPMPATDFLQLVADRLEARSLRYNEDFASSPADRIVSRIALCGGSGSDFIGDAERQQADVYVTGEIGYHTLFGHPGILLVEAGHYETERHTAPLLAGIIAEACSEVEVLVTETPNQTPVFTL